MHNIMTFYGQIYILIYLFRSLFNWCWLILLRVSNIWKLNVI